MDTSGDSQSSSTSWHRPALASLVALAVVIIAVALAGVRAAIEQAARPPMCYGVGFGWALAAGAGVLAVAVGVTVIST